ncbi:hypothetical protein TWF106_005513 [Orbilia oligospora]|nr:hypothetical protein TWF679_009214 [Orbilia oligospora]KAF3222709.1 hypothetical protein TWF106_005513 [Orbilia oligospora]KAF3243226.1 hypothetical protein TWF192_008399 [Orbilia oligospora]
MPSYTSIFVCSILALGASAQTDYGYDAPAPPADSYGAVTSAPESVAASVATSIASSVASSVATSITSSVDVATSIATSIATSAVTSAASSETSSEPAKATAAAAACPINFEKGCGFLCSGPKFAPSCETEWFFSKDTAICTPCPGIPDKCPPAPEPSCAFVCKAQGAAASKGEAETPFCWASDITKEGEIACTPCGGDSGDYNVASATPPPPSNVSISTQTYENGTATISTHHGNNTTYAPPPIYTSGASTMTIGASAIIGLALAFFAL